MDKKLLLASSAGLAMACGMGCKKDDNPSRTDLLTGEWQISTIDTEPAPDGQVVTFKFEADNDFEFCYEEDSASICFKGSWEWDANEEEIDMNYSFGGDSYELELAVERLTDDILEGDLTNVEEGETLRNVVMEKVN